MLRKYNADPRDMCRTIVKFVKIKNPTMNVTPDMLWYNFPNNEKFWIYQWYDWVQLYKTEHDEEYLNLVSESIQGIVLDK